MSSSLENGAIFAGRYRVERRIAIGGMGVIYEVLHLETERRRALKVMLSGALEDDELRRRFLSEAKVGARIDSDFVVDVIDAGIDEATRTPFLVMELLRGEDLGSRLKRLGRIDPLDVVTYLNHAALALDLMHRASIVHRDVKPENLFLMEREDGPPRVKVLDLGIAKVIAEGGGSGGDTTQGIGTPLYMAPEQYHLHAPLTGAVDVYALGMVAYALLVGSAYWAEEAARGRPFALVAVTMHGPQEPASGRAAARGVVVSPGFDAWFACATAVDPEARFATATEAVRALAEALGVAPPSRTVPSSPFGWSATKQDARDCMRSSTSERPLPSRVSSAGSTPVRLVAAENALAALRRLPRRGVVVGIAATMLVVAIISARMGLPSATRSRSVEPGTAPAPPPPFIMASVSAAPVPPRAAAPAGSTGVAPARSATGRTPSAAPLHSR